MRIRDICGGPLNRGPDVVQLLTLLQLARSRLGIRIIDQETNRKALSGCHSKDPRFNVLIKVWVGVACRKL